MNPDQTLKTLYAAIHAAEFPAQALLRLRTDLQSQPVAVLEGHKPYEIVCALNSHARKRGVALGMTRMEVEDLDGLHALSRSVESETAARAVMLECAAQFSPRIENASEGTACTYVLDIAGTERLFGQPQKLAERMRHALLSAGFRASIAVSTNFDAARMKAAAARGITEIPEGEEASALAKLPLDSLSLTEEHSEAFMMWGIRTLGELALLPEAGLVARMGQEARAWRELARGEAGHTFQPIEAKYRLQEFVEFETHVEQMDSLLFIGATMIDCLVARAANRAMSLALLTVLMNLEGGLIYEREIRPAVPSIDRKFLLKLLQLEIAAHPPQAAVVSLTLSAEAGQSSKVQLGLFTPQTPEPSRLDVTLARLKALVGNDRVGSPVLEDSHCSGSFRMKGFAVSDDTSSTEPIRLRVALRRIRPPRVIRVQLHAMRPSAFRERTNRYEVAAAYGPWRTSGCWWADNGWDAEEWDVLASESGREAFGCLLVLDRTRNKWQLEAFYD